MVAVGLNLSPFCRRYKNVIHSSVAIATKEIVELLKFSQNWLFKEWNIFYDTEFFTWISILPIADQIEKYKIKSFVQDY